MAALTLSASLISVAVEYIANRGNLHTLTFFLQANRRFEMDLRTPTDADESEPDAFIWAGCPSQRSRRGRQRDGCGGGCEKLSSCCE